MIIITQYIYSGTVCARNALYHTLQMMVLAVNIRRITYVVCDEREDISPPLYWGRKFWQGYTYVSKIAVVILRPACVEAIGISVPERNNPSSSRSGTKQYMILNFGRHGSLRLLKKSMK